MSEDTPFRVPNLAERLASGAKFFVILRKDPLRERIDVRTSEVLGLEGDVLFLAQTEPPVSREVVGATLELATLLDEGGALRPVGYAARLLDIPEDYPLPDHALVPALAFSAPGPEDFFETSLRMHYRVPVEEGMGVLVRLGSFETAELLDFSAGGARVRLHGDAQVEVGQSLPFQLLFLGSGYADGDGVVRSVQRAPDGGSLLLGIFFTNMEIRDIRYLERMVARIVSACRQRERDAEYL
ncbi:MAG: PilZ domain-containing protein [Proteobacteria bacterium]|nr:PilZ domain-containing protein [Pseudomonadota bacterium]MBU1596317.1 PilZ domain-containing protein [Pseudomonadota bacterium]